ncbi:hypothetical protein SERLA73DRAFT_181264 [Serpula lacrymans var. lacrymans S7.3]|uniref:Stress-response A/B barrel domain-containing protein n=2 Tax=Serpula lacrymans var. lacrymans TaxID=341189 RepID=F8PXR7_SERL3|nr:uncharacterized protein SERLADRAFT_467338 [Serpula lacrymans var. lacrymans S7.9]EGN98680.1 hypothetical protein SERLA73DRAFT_181264 [Serpula lacrymans var. lacrymans S7.3]EGO24283.1 hypothetical protein SERLADRAFT_467338 [Serpula lacrymans var. lacrymans S7.9]
MTIHHIVLYKLLPEATEENLESIKNEVRLLGVKIPQIKEVKVGHSIFNPLGQGFDDGVIFVFDNEDDLNAYRVHEAHISYQQFSGPYLKDKLIFDIEVDD